MLAVDRQERIVKLLNNKNFVRVSELSSLFEVSEETIRRDFDKLEKQGLLKKLHGGAMLNDSDNSVPSFLQRKKINIDGKELIGIKAAKLVVPGDTIILDSGTTTLYLAQALPDIEIKVLTYDINIAHELCSKSNIDLIVAGGTQRKNSFSLVGQETIDFLSSFNATKGFLSTSGIHLEKGLSVSNTLEANIKKKIIDCSNEIICLADKTKFDKSAFVSFAKISSINKLICNGIEDDKYITIMKENSIDIVYI